MPLIKSSATLSAELPTAEHANHLCRGLDDLKESLSKHGILAAIDPIGAVEESDFSRGYLLDLAMSSSEQLQTVGSELEQAAAKLGADGIEFASMLTGLQYQATFTAATAS